MSKMKKLKDYLFPAIVIAGIGLFAFSGRTDATGAEYVYARRISHAAS